MCLPLRMSSPVSMLGSKGGANAFKGRSYPLDASMV